MNYWLLKSEPGVFGIDDLAESRDRRTTWDGVRNYQARNFMREMTQGDEAFFYHSNCARPGIVGRMRVVREAHPDPTQFDPRDEHYDPRSRRDAPRWSAVDLEFAGRFAETVTLARLREEPALADMLILRRGNRLSVTPLTASQWRAVLALAEHS